MSILNKAYENQEKIKITTELGTDLEMQVNRELPQVSEGIFHKKGDWGNLPDGEAYFAPLENHTNGTIIIDASMAGIGKLTSPIKIEIKDGYAINIEGKQQAEQLKKLLTDFNNKTAYNIAELGIGTNDKAIITGIILEDEKVLGTAHIALGNNLSYGGTVNAPCHLDGIFLKPTIEAGNKTILKKGKLLL